MNRPVTFDPGVWALLLYLGMLVWPVRAAAQTPDPGCETGTVESYLDANDIRAKILNTGTLFWNGGTPVYELAEHDTTDLMFTTSLIVGGMMDDRLRMAGSTYGPYEFWPGPVQSMDTGTGDCGAFDRIWKVTREELERFDRTGVATRDIQEWPWRLGAPVIDGDGNPDNYNPDSGDRPEIAGDQTAWWIMNDAAGRHAFSLTDPIGLDVRVTAFAFDLPGPLRRATLYRYRITNRSDVIMAPDGAHLEGAWIGLFVDTDFGRPVDDLIGADTTLGMGYNYSRNPVDDRFGEDTVPPAMGTLILDSPGVHRLETGPDGTVDHAGTTFMTSLVRHYSFFEDVNGRAYLNRLQGRWLDGQPVTYGGDGRDRSNRPTPFMYPADPPEFWSDYNQSDCGAICTDDDDRRFYIGSGPFSLAPGESADFTFAIIYGQGVDHLDSVQELKKNARIIKDLGQVLLQPTYERQAPESEPPHTDFGISDPWPNPTTGAATLKFDVHESMDVDIRLFDMLGREIRTLLNERSAAGPGTVTIRTDDLPPGSYLIRARFGFHLTTREILVVK